MELSWFLVALGAPLVWSLVNYCDKIILSKYFKGDGSGGLMIFVGVISIPIAIFIGFINPDVWLISPTNAMYLIVSGILYNFTVFFYLKALEREDASYVVPFWQLMPVFAFFLGYIVLGESLSALSIIGGVVAIIGALILSLEFEKGKNLKIRHRVLLLMVASSFIAALGDVLFKKSAIDELPFLVSMFWNQIGMVIFAIAFFADKKYRKQFVDAIEQNSNKVLGLNIFEQIFEVIGIFIFNYSLLLAPVALITLVSYTAQPLFVFLEGILLTIFFPSLIKENLSRGHLLKKFFSIVVMSIGLYMITR